MKMNFNANEVVVKAGDSRHCFLNQQIGGKLIVTNQRIYFKSKNKEHQKFDLEIMPAEIKELIYYNTRWLVPNGLNIRTKNGEELHFVLRGRNEWASLINRMY